ncbi:MAG: divalent-cation tolerance protein CutA [Vampirovibrionales bacterium]|nr:divalent-cation tolerance protein CutA [Vampirovibrionales bacterium]
MQSPVLVVLVSCPPDDAERLAKGLVEARLAACVSIIPAVRSIYRWQEAVCDAIEAQLLIKTTVSALEPIKQWLAQEHPYECPECLVLETTLNSLEAYATWVHQNVTVP